MFGLKQQRNIGYGLLSFGVAIMTGFSLTAYSQGLVFFGVVSIVGVFLLFNTIKDAITLKGTAQDLEFIQCFRIVGGMYGLIFVGFMIVVLIGVIRGI